VNRAEQLKFSSAREREHKHWLLRQEKDRAELIRCGVGGGTGASSEARAPDPATHPATALPVAYVTGQQRFCSHSFFVERAVCMIPRQASEIIVLKASQCGHKLAAAFPEQPVRVLDLGTGSGCLLLSTLLALPTSSLGVGVDISTAALRVAAKNSDNLGLSSRARFEVADFGELQTWLFQQSGDERLFDILVCNPPYISMKAKNRGLDEAARAHEPALALFGGDDGLSAYKALNRALTTCIATCGLLREGGYFILEIGAKAKQAVLQIFVPLTTAKDGWELIEVGKDWKGHDRCLVLQWKPSPPRRDSAVTPAENKAGKQASPTQAAHQNLGKSKKRKAETEALAGTAANLKVFSLSSVDLGDPRVPSSAKIVTKKAKKAKT